MLERYEVLRSTQLDYTRDVVGRVFARHDLELIGRHAELDASMRSRRLRDMSVNYMRYGGQVRITPGELESFFVVQIPLSGQAQIRCGAQSIVSSPSLASVISPTERLEMRWSSDCAQLICRIERSALEARLSDLLDAPLREPLRFKVDMDVTTGYGQNWNLAVNMLVADLDAPGGAIEHPLVAHSAEQCLMTALLVSHPSNYTSLIERDTPRAAPRSRAVAIAVEWMENSPQDAHSISSLAVAAGVTERALQKGFRKQLDTTPMHYLRGIRLRRVRDELLAAQPGVATVSDVAARWGFFHVGRLAEHYRQQFGEKPSETLRQ